MPVWTRPFKKTLVDMEHIFQLTDLHKPNLNALFMQLLKNVKMNEWTSISTFNLRTKIILITQSPMNHFI